MSFFFNFYSSYSAALSQVWSQRQKSQQRSPSSLSPFTFSSSSGGTKRHSQTKQGLIHKHNCLAFGPKGWCEQCAKNVLSTEKMQAWTVVKNALQHILLKNIASCDFAHTMHTGICDFTRITTLHTSGNTCMLQLYLKF